ncbi:MAG: hypothetical protein Nk1A_5130 [Endomicrobiia bacterium]|nr:MAG: hypothetical protein Nk1A_5130 [Endomicrobiia bacterium]
MGLKLESDEEKRLEVASLKDHLLGLNLIRVSSRGRLETQL